MLSPSFDRNAAATLLLPRVNYYVGRFARGSGSDRLHEVARDAAIEALCRALNSYDPARGPFGPLCMAYVKQAVGRALGRHFARRDRRPQVFDLAEHPDPPASARPTAGEIPMTADLHDLPPDLRDAVRLTLIDRYTDGDAGLLCGVDRRTIRRRVQRAAAALHPAG